jgi:hypothetical protein
MEKAKHVKATWDAVAHRVFLDVCIEEVNANNRPVQVLNALGYKNLVDNFNKRTKRNYDRILKLEVGVERCGRWGFERCGARRDGLARRFGLEKLGKLLETSFSLRTENGLHGGRKLGRNWADLLGFSGLPPRNCSISPKEVTLIEESNGYCKISSIAIA